MIRLENIPKTGLLILSVYWNDYKDYYQNDARRYLKELLTKIESEKDINIESRPVQFSLIRVVSGGVARAVGAQYQYSFNEMTPEKFKTINDELVKRRGKTKWWAREDIMVASNIIGV